MSAERDESAAGDGDEQHRASLALHVCCGPCASAVLERLASDWRVTAVWHNPNIQPAAEYARRLEGMRTVAERSGVPLAELECDVERWHELCKGLMEEPEGGRRCDVCFRMRLERTAMWASEHGVETIATTLTISPHKTAERINTIGREVARQYGLEWLGEDFKKRGGFQRSVELSKEWGIYRQTWCGCLAARDANGGRT